MGHADGVGTRVCEVRGKSVPCAVLLALRAARRGTRVPPLRSLKVSGGSCGEFSEWPRKAGMTSENAVAAMRFDRRFRKEIIGHRMAVWRPGIDRGLPLHRVKRLFALFHQPARNHGRGVFLEPLIQQRSNLFAEIGGMAESSELVRLKRVSRSGQEKFPRGLGVVSGHGPFPPAGTGTVR
jgi:hypothetical protein